MNLKIKLYADGADINSMVEMYRSGIVSGFTTNPTLMRKAEVKNYEDFAKAVLKTIPDLPITFEVLSDDIANMEKEARKINSWGDNVYIKIPITTTKGESTSQLINKLSQEGLKLNVTAILTLKQVKIASDALSTSTPSIVSVFAGRIADTGRNPIPIMQKARDILRPNKNIELLWASTRELLNIIQAQNCGCHIITITNDILKKLPMLGKDLDELSLDTIRQFKHDAELCKFII